MGQTRYGNRPHCYRCARPQLRCVCAAVPRVTNHTPLWVLQHPRERTHPFATVPLLRLALSRLRVDVCWQVAASAPAQAELQAAAVAGGEALAAGTAPPVAVLFPSAKAQNLAELAPEQRPRSLLLLDGTWATVRGLLRCNPVLHQLPHVSLTPATPSRYRIRREPKDTYVSTLEAAVLALSQLEPERAAAYATLHQALDGMVEGQLALRGGRQDVRRRLRKR